MSYQQKRPKQIQVRLPGPRIVVRKGVKYDRVLVDGHTAASRNNLTGIASGVVEYFKYLPKN